MKHKVSATRFHASIGWFTAIAAIALMAPHGQAAVKARVEFDKTFDFARVRTWSWNADGAARIVLARSQQDDEKSSATAG